MTLFKSMMVAVALLMAGMPCTHGEEHAGHLHDADSGMELCASHACACHTCDTDSDMVESNEKQLLTSFSVTALPRTTRTVLFTLNTATLSIDLPAPHGTGILDSIETVQLLI